MEAFELNLSKQDYENHIENLSQKEYKKRLWEEELSTEEYNEYSLIVDILSTDTSEMNSEEYEEDLEKFLQLIHDGYIRIVAKYPLAKGKSHIEIYIDEEGYLNYKASSDSGLNSYIMSCRQFKNDLGKVIKISSYVE